MRFQVYSFASKKLQGFSSDRDINVVFISALSSTKLSQFFEIWIFYLDIWGNVHYVPEINLISKGTLINVFYLRSKTN